MRKPTIERDDRARRPSWLKVKAPGGEKYSEIRTLTRSKSLHTVCEEAHCPNIGECWRKGTATFIILGDVCTRNCRFCAIRSDKPKPPDPSEPAQVAEAVKKMDLKHAVITSVTRDDLEDGGAEIWAKTVKSIRELNPNTTVEVLIPDFQGDKAYLETVLATKPDILNHNVETVPRLYSQVRPKADYNTSLRILRHSAKLGFRTKSGIMVGLGETNEEIYKTLKDLKENGVHIVTIGQYLQPTKKHLPVNRFVTPKEFSEYKKFGESIEIEYVLSAPLVRSSYNAANYV